MEGDIAGLKGYWMLPVLTVVEPLRCPYRERRRGERGCRWHVVIADGMAYDYAAVAPAGYEMRDSGIAIPRAVQNAVR